MSDPKATQLTLHISAEDANRDEIDHLAHQLRDELQDLQGVESVELVRGGEAPQGSKIADPVTLGALGVAVLPTLLPKLVDFVQAWAMRGQGRTVKFKGKLGDQEVEFEGSPEDLKALLATLAASQPAERKPTRKRR